VRGGKRPLCHPLAVAVEDRATEQEDKHRDGKDNRTKAKARVSRQLAQRHLPAGLHRLTSAAQGTADDREENTLAVAPGPDLHFPARALDFDALPQFARAVGGLLAAAGGSFVDGLFDRFPGFAGALLDAAQQYILFAFDELEIVIRELGPLLLQLAFGDVPVAFDFEFSHSA
jgi:hypothetical protein